MGRIRLAFERLGRRLGALLTRPPTPGPVADLDPSATSGASPAIAAAPSDSTSGEPGPTFRNRARLRRRLRYLRQTRELGFRDLGGFMFDSNRLGRERSDIVDAKLEGLKAIDRELRALELALADVQDVTLLHEPGISVCPRCGALHGSEDNYCPACGLAVGRGLGLAVAQGGPGGAAIPAPPPAPEPDAEQAPETPGEADAGEGDAGEGDAGEGDAGDAAAAAGEEEAQTSETPSVAKP